MRNLKRFTALLLAMLLLISIPVYSFAEGGLTPEERAEQFVAAVNSAEDAMNIMERISAIENAYSEDIYFDDETYEGVAEAKQTLEELKAQTDETVGYCEEYINVVNDALMLGDEYAYADLKALLDSASALSEKIDREYDGVRGALSEYSALASELLNRESYTLAFLDKIEQIREMTTYSEKRRACTDIESLVRNDSFLPDYPGAPEGLAYLEELEEEFKAVIKNATKYKLAVDSAASSSVEEYRSKLLACYTAADSVDYTVDIAAEAKAHFDRMVAEYNAAVEVINSIFR